MILNSIILKLGIFLLWLSFGYYLYNNSIKYKNFVNNTTWYKCYFITYLYVLAISYILNIIHNLILIQFIF